MPNRFAGDALDNSGVQPQRNDLQLLQSIYEERSSHDEFSRANAEQMNRLGSNQKFIG